MAYLLTLVFTALLALVEVSFLPHFRVFNLVPFITLAFFVGLGVLFRGVFHILLAFVVGVFFSSISGTYIWLFPIIFVLVVVVGKYFFFRETGYNATQSFLILYLISSAIILLFNSVPFLLKQPELWPKYLWLFLTAIILNFVFGLVIYRIFDKYYDWLNKKFEESYR
jgi:hypothetical protein